MSCKTNFNTKIIKLHDTKFWCCDKLQKSESVGRDYWIKPNDPSYKEYAGTISVHGEYMNERIDYCPFCGSKLR